MVAIINSIIVIQRIKITFRGNNFNYNNNNLKRYKTESHIERLWEIPYKMKTEKNSPIS